MTCISTKRRRQDQDDTDPVRGRFESTSAQYVRSMLTFDGTQLLPNRERVALVDPQEWSNWA